MEYTLNPHLKHRWGGTLGSRTGDSFVRKRFFFLFFSSCGPHWLDEPQSASLRRTTTAVPPSAADANASHLVCTDGLYKCSGGYDRGHNLDSAAAHSYCCEATTVSQRVSTNSLAFVLSGLTPDSCFGSVLRRLLVRVHPGTIFRVGGEAPST